MVIVLPISEAREAAEALVVDLLEAVPLVLLERSKLALVETTLCEWSALSSLLIYSVCSFPMTIAYQLIPKNYARWPTSRMWTEQEMNGLSYQTWDCGCYLGTAYYV